MWFPNGLHLLFFNSLASIILSLIFIFLYKNSLNSNVNKKYFLESTLKITGILNFSVFLIILLLVIIIGTFYDAEAFYATISLFSLLTLGTFLILIIGVDIILIYFFLFSIPLCIGSFVLTILQQNHLTKRKMIFYLALNAVFVILLIILINTIFRDYTILESIKGLYHIFYNIVLFVFFNK